MLPSLSIFAKAAQKQQKQQEESDEEDDEEQDEPSAKAAPAENESNQLVLVVFFRVVSVCAKKHLLFLGSMCESPSRYSR